MATTQEIRKILKAHFPGITFKVKTVDFTDLARGSAIFVSSDAWGMTKGNQELYHQVEAVTKPLGAIVSW